MTGIGDGRAVSWFDIVSGFCVMRWPGYGRELGERLGDIERQRIGEHRRSAGDGGRSGRRRRMASEGEPQWHCQAARRGEDEEQP
jgi:hypothetical protein